MAKYDASFKKKVVKEYLEGQVGYSLLAKKYGISSKKQIQWVRQFEQYGEKVLELGATYDDNMPFPLDAEREAIGGIQ